jgi:hypothetical protein
LEKESLTRVFFPMFPTRTSEKDHLFAIIGSFYDFHLLFRRVVL